ncbi:metal-dependent hydrolase [Candidatus Babeliales bacterium]|nr:metal-dependent hydrolase [Candidatus Babeliales bacterium]
MPSYRVHLVGGFVIYIAVLHCLQSAEPTIVTVLQGLVFCLLGALFPDIDVKSKGQKVFYSLLLMLLLYLLYHEKYCMFVVMSFLGIIPILVRHRGVFHHVWFLMAITFGASLFVKSFCGFYEQVMLSNCWFFFVGTVSHVMLDRIVSKCKSYMG